MPTTCVDLMPLKCFQQIRLVAGRKGLYRKLSWPYVCFTPTISQWLHGGELIFVVDSGMQADEQGICRFLGECIEHNMAGMVILVGGDSGLSVSAELKALADEKNFPLFEMPWSLKMIDVTQEIAEMIVAHREATSKVEHFLEQAYFMPDEPHKLEKLCAFCDITLRPFAFTAILQASASILPGGGTDVLSRLSYAISMHKRLPDTQLLYMKHLSNVLLCGLADSQEDCQALCAQLTEAFHLLEEELPDQNLRLALSRVHETSVPLPVSYSEARKTLDVMNSDLTTHNILSYQELGVLRLFYDVSQEELRAYCMENLGPLLNADQDNNSALVPTLKAYLHSNCNLVKAAADLFIHRNTLIYRLNIIRQLLGKEINDPFVKNELFNSLLVLELLDIEH